MSLWVDYIIVSAQRHGKRSRTMIPRSRSRHAPPPSLGRQLLRSQQVAVGFDKAILELDDPLGSLGHGDIMADDNDGLT